MAVSHPHNVRTATLVAPRLTSAASLNRTNTRLTAGAKGTLPSPCTKTAKVGVAPVAIVVVTELLLGVPTQIPVVESVWQIVSATGSATMPVSTEAVMKPPAPTFTAATEKAPTPVTPGMLTIPSVVSVPTSATMSGTGLDDPESWNVLTPTYTGAGSVFVQSNCNTTACGGMTAVGVKAKTKLCDPPGWMFTGVSGAPMTWFVTGSVGANEKLAARFVTGERLQASAVSAPKLMTVAKAVAGVPT